MICSRIIPWYTLLGFLRTPRYCAFSFSVRGSFAEICNKIDLTKSRNNVQLVVVSKTKPCELLREAYDAGAREFGENYIQELCEKAPQMPPDINWHFIGHLQSNKAKKLVTEVPNLSVVESVDSLKLAKKLNNACDAAYGDKEKKLAIYIQINTSAEKTKSGVMPSEAASLAQAITTSCPRLAFSGLMTIGAPGDESCFDALANCRTQVSQALHLDESTLQLSMGMSSDFERAILKGSTSVRIGSRIFGARDYPI